MLLHIWLICSIQCLFQQTSSHSVPLPLKRHNIHEVSQQFSGKILTTTNFLKNHRYDMALVWQHPPLNRLFQLFIQEIQILTKELKKNVGDASFAQTWYKACLLSKFLGITRSAKGCSTTDTVKNYWPSPHHNIKISPASFWILEATCFSFTNFTYAHLC